MATEQPREPVSPSYGGSGPHPSIHRYPRGLGWAYIAVIVLFSFFGLFFLLFAIDFTIDAELRPAAPIMWVMVVLMLGMVWYARRWRRRMREFRLEIDAAGFRIGAEPLVRWEYVLEVKVIPPMMYSRYEQVHVRYRDGTSDRRRKLAIYGWLGDYDAAKAALLAHGGVGPSESQ